MRKKILNELKESMQLVHIEKEGALTGLYRGYNISLGTIPRTNDISYITIPLKLEENFKIEEMNVFLDKLRSKYKGISLSQYENFKLELNYYPRFRKYNKSEIILNIINEVLDFAMHNKLTTCCEFCGETTPLTPILINGAVALTCVNCKLEVKNSISMSQQAEKAKRSNIIGGIVGSVLGVLLGSLIWIFIYQLGYIAAIGGLAIAVCSIKGYEMFGGKLNFVGILLTSIITIVGVYAAQHVSLALEILSAYKEDGVSLMECIRAVPYFLEEPDILRPFLCDLGIGYLLTLISSVSYIHNAYKERNCKVDIQDIEM